MSEQQRKKLGEMGTRWWGAVGCVHGEPKEFHAVQMWKRNDAPAGQEYIVFTPDQLRELVKQSVFMFIMDFISSYDLGRGDSLGDAMTEFVKEQGL